MLNYIFVTNNITKCYIVAILPCECGFCVAKQCFAAIVHDVLSEQTTIWCENDHYPA